jgi:uncharacterized protein (TIGR02217 family)
MIQEDSTPVFPACPSYGFTADPHILVKIIMREGGFEKLDRKCNQALRKYDGFPTGDRPQDDIEEVLYFWLALGGMSTGFRFKDWTDYKSCRLSDEPSALDQPFSFEAGSPGGYRLVKQYTYGAYTHTRTIYRPVGDTIMVANSVGAVQDPSTWLLEESTGLLQTLPGFTGTPGSWGGEFDVYCRFNAPFVPEISNFQIQRASISLIEKRERS